MKLNNKTLVCKKVIFWDFDGVIKDSVAVKSDAYEQLFKTFRGDVSNKVKLHHEANGGMSRFDKFPLYLKWAGEEPSQKLVDQYSKKFSNLVKQKVIDSAWVPGVIEYIEKNAQEQKFFIVTATPQLEIEEILDSLDIRKNFLKIIGAPTPKENAIRQLLVGCPNVELHQTVMIGDASSDHKAAELNQVPFILRRTDLNHELQRTLDCQMINDFYDLN